MFQRLRGSNSNIRPSKGWERCLKVYGTVYDVRAWIGGLVQRDCSWKERQSVVSTVQNPPYPVGMQVPTSLNSYARRAALTNHGQRCFPMATAIRMTRTSRKILALIRIRIEHLIPKVWRTSGPRVTITTTTTAVE